MSQFLRISVKVAMPLALVFTSGCETTSVNRDTQNTPVQSSQVLGEGVSAGLKPRTLERGECGLFVWSADAQRRFILFSQSQKSKAIWAGPNGEQELKIASKSGQIFQGQYTRQNYSPETMTLSLQNIEEIIDSTRFKGGTLSRISADGFQRIEPIIALSTCR